MSAPDGKGAPRLSRRRFVTLTGAGLAALSAGAGGALAASETKAKAKKPAATTAEASAAPSAPPAPAMTPHEKEFARQKTVTLATLKTLRDFPLPPGGDLPVVFKPMRTPKKGR